jgi:hypothetical protein
MVLVHTQVLMKDVSMFNYLGKELGGKRTLNQVDVHNFFAPPPIGYG